MSDQNTIIDESVLCMDDECQQRAACKRWTTREDGRYHSYATTLRPRWMPQDGDCIYWMSKEGVADLAGHIDILEDE